MKPYMLTAQYNDDNSNDDSIRTLCEQQANQGGYFLLNLRSCPKEQDPTWDISLGFAPICLESSDRLLKLERNSIFTSTLQKELRKLAMESAIARFQRTGVGATVGRVLSSPRGQHALIGNLSKVDRKKAERINQELQKNLCQTFQTEAGN